MELPKLIVFIMFFLIGLAAFAFMFLLVGKKAYSLAGGSIAIATCFGLYTTSWAIGLVACISVYLGHLAGIIVIERRPITSRVNLKGSKHE